ncbi:MULTISPECIES: hypothetical protein [Niastella]|uniref:Uncharacterized protein n=1 Tax=Niastella soli TaxID=2821487 RepID=A0ABS3Z5D6_9BACT|nr:hypothetical protein [Niastella soli]MBO9205364.1 hypothetical protein [Niastella soli]
MTSFISILKFFVVVVCCWYVACIVFGTHEAASDGSDEIGFPVTFKREFNGKCDPPCVETGFFPGKFILDILIVFVISFVARSVVHRIKVRK